MEDEKKVNYVTKEEFMTQISVVWMFIMLTLIAIIWGDQVFSMGLISVSFLMFVAYMVGYGRAIKRHKRQVRS